MDKKFDGGMDLRKLIFRTGEVTKITGVSARQLRYWDQKGYVKSERTDENSSRVYSFFSLLRVVNIKNCLDEGYTLNAAIKKMEENKEKMQRIHHFFRAAYQGLKTIDDKIMIDLGYLNEDKKQRLYGYIDGEEAKYQVINEE